MNEQFKFNGHSVVVTNYRECEALLKMLNREKNKLEEIMDYVQESTIERQRLGLQLNEIDNTIKKVNKAINKYNGYTKIGINVEEDYGVTTTVITFNKKWTNDRIKTWLYQNDYPIKSERIPVCTDYDCSGQIYYVGFNLKNQIATITEHRDV